MIDFDRLRTIEELLKPLVMRATPVELATIRATWLASGLNVKSIHGERTRTSPELFDEFCAALEFPEYFGRNWNALSDCITDLSWLDMTAGLVLIVTEPLEVLSNAAPTELRLLADVLTSAAENWGQPVEEGEWWDRPARPFHIVLSCEAGKVDAVIQRWAAAGFSPNDSGSGV